MRPEQNGNSRGVISRWLAGLILTCLLILGTARLAIANPLSQTAEQGQAIFKQKCSACHTIGGGKLVGPDLKDVTQRRELTWLKDFISDPNKVIASGDPVATQLVAEYNNMTMPNLGLTPEEVDSLLAYLENPTTAGSAPASALPVGDPVRGEMLFTGASSLGNGGPNCIACHSVAGITALGGGSLGPDLTHVMTRYGPQGLASALNTLPFPTMQGIFANRPLAPNDQADLYAFFEKVDQQPASSRPVTFWFLGIGIAGTLVLFGALAVFWPRQRQGLAERLRRNS